MDPFPGEIGQIVQAKFQNETPDIPLEFPAALKNLICNGWSKKPKERPKIEKFRSALSLMLKEEEQKIFTANNENIMTDSRESPTLTANCLISSEKIAEEEHTSLQQEVEVKKTDKFYNRTPSPRNSMLKEEKEKCMSNIDKTMATGSTFVVNIKGD
jgi:hypothetical protein